MEYSKIFADKARITSRFISGSSTETTANFTIRFVFGGNEMCTIGRRRLSVHTDSFIVLNKGTKFTSEVEDDAVVNIFTIEFNDSFLNDFNRLWLHDDNIFNNEPADGGYLKYDLIETIYPFRGMMRVAVNQLKEHLESGMEDRDIIHEYLNHCLVNYYRIYNEEIFQKATRLNFLHYNTRIEILKRLNLAKEYLYANYNGNVNLENLADHACLSVNHLLRTFKLAYNQSPHQFLIQLRLQRAQLLLTKTEYPVYEIVNMVGFKCTSSFIRLFRTRYKTTPLKYRNVLAA
jgi:AraC family transcriptional regulator